MYNVHKSYVVQNLALNYLFIFYKKNDIFTKFVYFSSVKAFKDYQKRRSDIYQALAIQHELHPLYSSELHGFIEFLKLKPELLHGYLDFFSPYLSKVSSQANCLRESIYVRRGLFLTLTFLDAGQLQ